MAQALPRFHFLVAVSSTELSCAGWEPHPVALEHEPKDQSIQTRLIEYYKIGQQWKELEEYYLANKNIDGIINVYELQLDNVTSQQLRALVHCKLARIYEISKKDKEAAIQEYRIALRIDPQLEFAIDALKQLGATSTPLSAAPAVSLLE